MLCFNKNVDLESWDVEVLHIVFLVLKTGGVIAGIILTILVLLLLLFLFVPIRYQVLVDKEQNWETAVSVYWLLKIVHFKGIYQAKQFKYCLRIFGIPIKQNRKRKEKKRKEKKSVKRGAGCDKIEPKTSKEELAAKEKNVIISNDQKQKQSVSGSKDKKSLTPVRVKGQEKNRKNHKKKISLRSYFQNIRKRLKNRMKSFREKILNWKKSIKRIQEKKEHVFTFLKSSTTKHSLHKSKKSVLSLLKHMGPRKISGTLLYGMEDPAQTGVCLGLASVLLAYFSGKNKRLKVIPDFEKEVLEIQISVKGRFLLARVLFICLKLFMDKEFRSFMQDIKLLKEELS